jgi:hypothetical protein
VGLLVLMGLAAAPLPTRADVVMARLPDNCREGTRPVSGGHGGPYCEPPPPKQCPKGYKPTVYGEESYWLRRKPGRLLASQSGSLPLPPILACPARRTPGSTLVRALQHWCGLLSRVVSIPSMVYWRL